MDKVKVILAKYWVAILCGVIALASVVTSFIPLNSYHEELHTKLQASASNFQKSDALMHKVRNKPLLPGQTTPEPLTVFPSASIIATGEALRDKLNVESQKSVKTVVDINRHTPILPILPNPNAGTDGINYRTAYVKRLVGQDAVKPTLQTDVLNSANPPTLEEVKAESDRIWKTEFETQLVPDPSNPGKSMNEDSVKAQFKAVDDTLAARMRQDIAKSHKIYCAKDAIPVDNAVAAIGALPNVQKIWWSQMQLWVIEDVASAIAEANKASPNVTTSPVKRLNKLEILGTDQTMLFTGAKNPVAPVALPAPTDPNAPVLTADANTPVVLNRVASPTGRVSNSMFDVIQFRLDLVVAAKDIPWVIESLCRGRMMSVINVESLIAEDTAAADAAGFIYGPDQVVHISLRCETLFMREWTIPLMPDVVKRAIAAGAAPVTN